MKVLTSLVQNNLAAGTWNFPTQVLINEEGPNMWNSARGHFSHLGQIFETVSEDMFHI